jgi:hypothetical protein
MRATDHDAVGGARRDRATREGRAREGAARGGRTRARRLCALAAFVSLLILSAACSQDPQKEVREELRTLSSWARTLRLLAESWREGSVPSRYAAKTAREAREALQEELQAVQQSSSVPADARAALAQHAQTLDALASSLSQAARGGDREGAAQLVVQLSGEQQSLDALARGAGAPAR